MSAPTRYGFTLIELSMVLVIIGLIVGGVVAGKALIQQAEIRAAVSQLQKFETAYRTFQVKYGCIIGDCPYATDLFGTNYINDSGSCTLPNGLENGDGNGLIDSGGGGRWQCEDTKAIKSLKSAQLLSTSDLTPCWANDAALRGIHDSCGYFYNDDLYNRVTPIKVNSFSWATMNGGGNLHAAVLSPVETRLIDEKLDDGKATTGKFRGLDASVPLAGGGIVANSCVTAGAYNLNEDFTCRALYYFK